MRFFLTLSLLCLCRVAANAAGTYHEVAYPPSEKPGELALGVTYTIWIPDDVKTVRGVIVHQHGCGSGACKGGATAAYDLHWQALAKKWDCALLGPSYHQDDRQNCRLWCDPRNGSRQTFLNGLGDSPPANATLRAELNATPLPELLRELEQRDPVTFQIIDRQNPRRVVRALEVIRETGKPFSAQRADWKSPSQAAPAQVASRFFCFKRSNETLRARSSARVDWMFENGLVDETKKLLERGLAENQTAIQAIGYRQVVEHLRGERALAETIELVKIRTRQFAKRQLTWFRRQLEPVWIELSPPEQASSVVAQMLTQFLND